MKLNLERKSIGSLLIPNRFPFDTYIGSLLIPIGSLLIPIKGILTPSIGSLLTPILYLPWGRGFSLPDCEG